MIKIFGKLAFFDLFFLNTYAYFTHRSLFISLIVNEFVATLVNCVLVNGSYVNRNTQYHNIRKKLYV